MALHLHYRSKVADMTLMDSEEKIFETKNELIDYLKDRLDKKDNETIYVFGFLSYDPNFIDATITRHSHKIFEYLVFNPDYEYTTNNFWLLEFQNYSDALGCLRLHLMRSNLYL